MRVRWLIVGAGYTGCVLAERIATQLEQNVLILDRRDHVGGNAYDYYDEYGVLVHRYGPHYFHTDSEKVWDYLSRFTEWRPYSHRVLAAVNGKKVPVPFNLNSLHLLFSAHRAQKLETLLLQRYGANARVPILKMLEETEGELRNLAEHIYEKIFQGYTLKQWGLKPTELDPSVTARIPVCLSRDDGYFPDFYQAMPKYGYTEMFRRMLANPRIHTVLKKDFRQSFGEVKFKRMIYTGPIEEFFDYVHGELPYRSLQFKFAHYLQDLYQETAQVNYPNEHSYTRISEFKHATGQQVQGTTVVFEYPQPYRRGENEPHYPIPREEHRERYNLYLREVAKLKKSVFFAGRLADYRYYNMDQAVARALDLFEKNASQG